MSFRLFREEEDLVASARKVLDGGQFDDAEARTRFEDLLQGYEKLFKDTRRLVRISDRNEAELNRLAQSLEEQADELRTARDAAEAATRAKDAFLATMSHEIRTPMNGVVGMIDLLAETALETDQRQMLDTVRNSAFALLTIINDILDFSKIEAGKMTLEAIPVSLRDIVEGVAETLAATARDKDEVRVRCFVDPEIPVAVMGDEVRLRQILFNLGGNAVKFTEAGTVTIRADRIDEEDPAAASIRFEVIDTGIGILEDARPKLFEAFSQADESTTRRFGGTGLGLSICVRLTKLMGGSIDVESTVGKGSTFSVEATLPVAADHDIADDRQDLAGVRVALAARDDAMRPLLTRYLDHCGAEVVPVDDLSSLPAICEAALSDEHPFAVAVLGSGWPLEQQVAVAGNLRKSSASAAIGIVALSSDRATGNRPVIDGLRYVDAAPMRRAPFLRAVAVAAGRLSPEADQAESTDRRKRRKAPSVADAEAAGELILVVDDNATNRDVVRRQLGVLGYAADITADGSEALDAWRQKRYGLVLTDCQMPVMNGYQLARAIRDAERDSDRRTPIVAITASTLQGSYERCYDSGMDDVLPKPVEMPRLEAMIEAWMPRGDLAETAPVEEPGTGRTDVPVADPSSPVDPSALAAMFGDDAGMMREVLRDFVGPSWTYIRDIEGAIESRSADVVAKAAHKLKSSSRAVGANALADLCLALETAGKAGNWTVIDAEGPKLDGAMQAVADHVDTL